MQSCALGIVSDIHYASAAEQARGPDYEICQIPNPVLRQFVKLYRNHVWLREPMQKGYLLDKFLALPEKFDLLVANGDYSCNTASVGVSDDAAFASASECLNKLRRRFGAGFEGVIGDHELGKFSFIGRQGGLRFKSLQRATNELGLRPAWLRRLGRYHLIGVTSSLLAFPLYKNEALPDEEPRWWEARNEHLAHIAEYFSGVAPGERVLLFCHDPTALPFLAGVPAVASRMDRIERTIIGHLHSKLILAQSKLLAGIPKINFLGHTAQRLSAALREARHWKPFKLLLCPSLAGIELLKDGGYYRINLDCETIHPADVHFNPLPR